jgi:hypothetical protein
VQLPSGSATADERRHAPPDAAPPGWREVFDLAFWTPRGTFGGHVTLLFPPVFPPGRPCLYWTSVMEEGRSLVTVVEHDVARPRSSRSLEIRAPGIWADHNCESPFRHWSYGLEAFAVRLDRPEDALDDGRGERVGLGYDLEWEDAGDARVERLPVGDGGAYRQAGRVHGEILLGPDTYEIDGLGMRAHWWGSGRWPWTEPVAGRSAPTVASLAEASGAEASGAEASGAEASAVVRSVAEALSGEDDVVGRSMARVPGDGVVERRLLRRAGGPTLVTLRS